MKITVKDMAELTASILAKHAAHKAKGKSDDVAMELVKSYIEDNEFVDGEGTQLQIDVEHIDFGGGSSQLTSKAISDAVRDGMKEVVTSLKSVRVGSPTGPAIETKERWEAIFTDAKDPNHKNWGFKNIGDFAQAVYRSNHPVESMKKTDDRLATVTKAAEAFKRGHFKATPTTYASELVGADGGFLVPPEYREEIWIAVRDEYSILGMIDMTPTFSNVVDMTVDQNAPWDNTSGIQVYWRQQASTMSQSKPIYQNRQVALNEIYALVPATDELLADAPRLNNYLGVKAPEKMGYAIDDSIFRGTGQGQPLGFLPGSGPSTITVTANATASSGYSVTDLANMYPHLLQGSNMQSPDGVWVMTPRDYALLPTLGTSSNAGFPLALQQQNIEGRIINTVFGMPVYSSQHSPGLNQTGDVSLVNFKRGYKGFNKTDGFDFQSSIHLFFDSGAVALRWRFRFGGEPMLRSTIASANDTGNTMSHFVVLGSRTPG